MPDEAARGGKQHCQHAPCDRRIKKMEDSEQKHDMAQQAQAESSRQRTAFDSREIGFHAEPGE